MDILTRFERIASALEHDAASFPTSAMAALRVREALNDPDCPTDRAVRLIQAEPLLATRVVATANSLAYNRMGREVSDVKTALTRLGFATVRTLATALVTRQMAGNPQTPALRQLTEQLWSHTAHVAALARLLAQRVTHQNPDTALFAGVVHEITGFYLLSCAQREPELIAEHYGEWAEQGEPRIGRLLLARLAVPAAVAQAIEGLWLGYLALPAESLTDTLLLADELAPVASPLREARSGQRQENRARIEMAVGSETLSDILAQAASEVDDLVKALRS